MGGSRDELFGNRHGVINGGDRIDANREKGAPTLLLPKQARAMALAHRVSERSKSQ